MPACSRHAHTWIVTLVRGDSEAAASVWMAPPEKTLLELRISTLCMSNLAMETAAHAQ